MAVAKNAMGIGERTKSHVNYVASILEMLFHPTEQS